MVQKELQEGFHAIGCMSSLKSDRTRSHSPSQRCRQGAGRPCLQGSCRSCWCRWERKPGQENTVKTRGPTPPARGRGFRTQLTSGVMGGVSVPFLRPSQLNPSNHLNAEDKAFEPCLCFHVRHSNASLGSSLVLLDVFNAVLLVAQPLRRVISVHTKVCGEKTLP